MKNFANIAAFAAGAHALVGRDNTCCFHMSATGGASGSIGQLDDGQNRIGGGLSEAQFCIDSNGGIVDANGRGCIVTGATTQFQCDLNKPPTPGFSINSKGQLTYENSEAFVACETGMNGGLNLYTTESEDVTMCQDIVLMADTCSGTGAGLGVGAGGGSSSAVPSGPATSSVSLVPGGGAGGGASTPSVPGAGATSAPHVPGGGASTPSVPQVPGGGATSAPH
ncbi:hypothetical protein BDW42DRAFT_192871, partial [Aspergillus taichungensis]